MQLKEVVSYLSLCKVREPAIQIYGDDRLQISCPLARWLHGKRTDESPSCSIKYGQGKPTTYICYSCKSGGRFHDLLDSYGRLTSDDSLIKIAQKLASADEVGLVALMDSITPQVNQWFKPPPKISRPKVFASVDAYHNRFFLASQIEIARQYLYHRGIHKELWDKWDLRFDPLEERLVFSVYDEDNRLVGAVGRALYAKNKAKYKNYLGFYTSDYLGGMNFIDRSFNKIIVVEGFFNILRAYEWARERRANIVCTFTAHTSDAQASLLIELGQSIQYWYDNDDAGNLGYNGNGKTYWGVRQALIGKVPSLKRAMLPENKDVAQMSKDDFETIFEQTSNSFPLSRKEIIYV